MITHATFGTALAAARLFADEGAYVFITGKCEKRLNEAVVEIGKNVRGIVCDESKTSDLDHLFSVVKNEKGHIDILFACSAHGEFATTGNLTAEHLQTMIDKVQGSIFSVQKALPLMHAGGSIILGGSALEIRSIPSFDVYNASQALLRFFAGIWYNTLKFSHVRVNILSPGTSETSFEEVGHQRAEYCFNDNSSGSIGEIEVIASMALFLASSDSVTINGIEVFADGGSLQI